MITELIVLFWGAGMLHYAGSNLKENYYEGSAVPVYIEKQTGVPENAISLSYGSWEIELTYETENETNCTSYMQTAHGEDYGDTVVLLKEANEKKFDLMLYGNVTEFYIVSNEPTLNVHSITVRETNQWNRMMYTLLVLIVASIDLFLWQKQHKKWKNLSNEKKTVCLAVLFIGIVASIPLFTDYLISGVDMNFHLMRIEGLAEGLRNGDFPVRMQPLWINDYGYPVSIMYGDLLLYIPAAFRLAGFTLQTVYKLYIVGINILTAYTSYKCGKKVSGNYRIGIVMSLLYTLSGYRLTNAIYRAAVGELTAIAFIPLVFLGLWQLFQEDDKTKWYQSGVLLVIGYTGILESHLLSFEMVILFSALYCLVNGRNFWRRLKMLFQTALFTIGVNLFFLVPMLDYMLTQDMQVLNGSTVAMQDYGLFFPQLSQMFTFATNGSQLGILGPTSYGIGNEVLMGMGLPLAIIVCLYLWEQLVYKNERIEHSNKVFGLMLLSMWMTTYLFPWEILENIQGIGTLVAPYQFPWRFTGLTLGLGIILGSVALKNVQIVVGDTTKKVIIASISILAIIHFTSYSEMLIANAVPVKITSYAGIDTREAVVAGEYLLQNTYAMTIGAAEPQTEDGMTINNYKKEDGIVTLLYENLTGKDSYIKVPFFSYKGYHAVDSASGYELTIWHDWQNIAMILIPVDWSGELKVYFEEPIYWRVAEFISFTLVLWSLMHWVKIRWKKYLQR